MCLCHQAVKLGNGESWGVNRHAARYTSPVFVASQCWCLAESYRKRRSVPPHGPMWLGNLHPIRHKQKTQQWDKQQTSATQSGPPSSSINSSSVLGGSRLPRRSIASSRSRFKALAFSTALTPGTDCCGLPINT